MAGLEGKQLGDCEILSKLGQGGMGAVYKARQTALDRMVAIKVLPPQFSDDEDFLARFKREAAAAARLTHPNIVQVYAAGKQEDTHYFVMEFVDGENVQRRLLRKGQITPAEALAICIYVAQGLDYAWKRNKLIHRDIKPDNIFLSGDGEVKLGDLGLAKSAGGAGSGLTLAGAYMGTPFFVSPEQARGLKEIDFRADIYSLGCTLYYMVSGHRPYESEGCDALQVMFKHVNEPAPDVLQAWPQCPKPLAGLIAIMVRKKPEDRFQSYEELIATMKSVAAELRSTKPHVVVPFEPAASAPPEKKAPNKAALSEKKLSAKAAPAKDAKPPSTPPALLKPPLAEPKSPSFALIMIGTALACLLALGVFLWAPWQERAAVNGEADSHAKPAPPPAAVNALPVAAGTAAPVPSTPVALGETFAQEVAALPPERQVARVVAQLKALNLDYDGQETHEIVQGAVVELVLATESLRNLAPVAALHALKRFRVSPPHARRSALADLGGLAGLQLTLLDCHGSEVRDLTPLRGQPLEELDLSGCRKLADLTPLQGLKLRRLNLSNDTVVTNFAVLQGMPLEQLQCQLTRLRELAVLRDAPLKSLECDALLLGDAQNLDSLRAIKTLETLNGKPIAEFWKQLAAQPVAAPVAERLPEANEAAWQKALNLLPLIEPARDTVRGEWTREFDTLVGDRGGFAMIEIPYRPAAEYDYRVEFTPRKRGSVGALHLARGDRCFTFNFFGAGGATFGFECIDGKALPGNPTATRMVPMEVGRRYVTVVEVRTNEVRAFLNNCFVAAWKTDYADLQTDERWKLRDASLLGLGCQTRVEFHSARVREVAGKGTFTRQPLPVRSTSETAAPGARIERD